MELSRHKLGNYIEPLDIRNSNCVLGADSVVGISTQKEIIKTKADLVDVSLSSYKLFAPGNFAYVLDTSRRGDKVALAYNTTKETYLISSIYVVFKVKRPDLLLADYLFICFNRPEFDRYARFNSWGSARETFSWEDFCDIDIDLPPVEVQRKYVDVYNAMLSNQRSYERGLEDLKLTCDAYIEELRKEYRSEEIGPYIKEQNISVGNSKHYTVDDIVGISCVDKSFMSTKADTSGLSISTYKIVPPNAVSFNPNTARMGDRIPIALNETGKEVLVSAIYPVFTVNADYLNSDYLMMWLKRTEFDRYARFHSWGSARETFTWDNLLEVKIPIPPIEIQRAIANIYIVYKKRKAICEKLRSQIKDICPILIKGSLSDN